MNSYKLPIHLIRQYLFCPRVVYFLEVLNIPKMAPIWVNEGQKHHAKQAELFKRRTLARFGLENAEFENQVLLKDEKFDFYGISDGVIISDTHVYPVEVKLHGFAPTFSQKMQLIAYGVLAKNVFEKECDLGFILFENNAKTVPVKITNEDEARLLKLIGEIVLCIQKGKLPHSNANEAKCTQCEFENYCNDRF